jgi:hypothetical protein
LESARDFVRSQPTAPAAPSSNDATVPLPVWEQLAQVLFCSNEFLFID